MNITDILNNAIAYILVLGGIGGILIAFAKVDSKYNILDNIRYWINKNVLEKVDKLDYRLDNIETKQNEMQLDIYALKITSKGMPDEARYKASKKYLHANGNSGVDIDAKNFIKYYEEKHCNDNIE